MSSSSTPMPLNSPSRQPSPLLQHPRRWPPTTLTRPLACPASHSNPRACSRSSKQSHTKVSIRTTWSSMWTRARAPRHPERRPRQILPSPHPATHLPHRTPPPHLLAAASLRRPSQPLTRQPSFPPALTTRPPSVASGQAWERVPRVPRRGRRTRSTPTPATQTTRAFSRAARPSARAPTRCSCSNRA